MSQFEIKVPATTANLGVGFDSIGLALNKFLTVKASPADNWQFNFKDVFLKVLPNNEQNLVAKVANKVASKFKQTMPPLRVEMSSEIPLTHGLGSSSSAIVAGIELANHFVQLNLTQEQKIVIATEIEGHPDNVGPCVTGGLFIGAYENGVLFYETADFNHVGIILSIPDYELSTAEVRKVLPAEYSKEAIILQNAYSNIMTAALLKGDFEKMGAMMMKDLIHEPYRQPLIKEFDAVKNITLTTGAYATVISGAGPTILTLCPVERTEAILQSLNSMVPECRHEITTVYPLIT